MAQVRVWQEPVTFKTYKTGSQDQHPIFLEHRVYQGSSGAVYPYGVTDTLLDQTEDKVYQALYLENDYLKIMILPELGGRVHRAYDKVNQRDFVYFNHVVKPALVGLLGPWISGGIEFNTPQHHRPTTFMGLDFSLEENADGSATIFVGEREPMHGLTITTGFTLFPDKALLQIKSRIFNGNDTPRSFLWWANPAVKGGDGHQSVFPPDVTAVFDHGKRAVIDFPIAHGEYYKVKYDGVDISRYKNIPVPTSYMAWRSDYDFVGAYCHDEDGGLLHIADHHVSPGKKQWSWGYGDFGQAWDRNLTDEDGPYIELMTGVYTDNQPDFTWLEPGESKEFVQNFLPYSKLGTLQNATTQAAIKLERREGKLELGVYAIEAIRGEVVITTEAGMELHRKWVDLTPCRADMWSIADECAERLVMKLIANGKTIVSYTEHIAQPVPLPEIAKAPAYPQDIKTTDEAFFIGQHLEQYHHATRNNYDYYLRGLEIDPLDYRCNVAMGNFEYNRCNYEKALEYATKALERAHMLNRNSACSLGSVLKANCLFKLGRLDEAYDEYFRATWAYNGRTKGYIGLSTICALRDDYTQACYFAQRALQTESTNQDALALQAYTAIMAGSSEALDFIEQGFKVCPISPLLQYLKCLVQKSDLKTLDNVLHQREINYLTILEFLLKVGRRDLAFEFCQNCAPVGAIANLMYAALIKVCPKCAHDANTQKTLAEVLAKAQAEFKNWVRFPNFTFERDVLDSLKDEAFALHLCACFDYSHRLYERAALLWQECLKLDPTFVEAWRGLGIYQFNKLKDQSAALNSFAQAIKFANGDERVLFENDLLLKLTHHTPEQRIAVLEQYSLDNLQRDDLKAELVTLYNQVGAFDKAETMLKNRIFHVWEGGEGRVTGQFINNAILRAKEQAAKQDYEGALETVTTALTFPHNLGEGKLVVQTDNDLYFYAACYAAKAGKSAESASFLEKAMVGETTIAEQHYYNDLPCDYVFYNALAQKISGKQTEAQKVFETMRDWSYDAFDEEVYEDFFAVSLPDLVVLDRNLKEARQENCMLMRLLASIGLKDHALFDKTLQDFKNLQPSNFKISLYENLADSLFEIAEQGKF